MVTLTSAFGDTSLAVGMKRVGPVSLSHPDALLAALRTPWVFGGVLLLLLFFASYLTALSWADLTFVLPATSLAYVAVAFLSKFWLHEQISTERWLGIALITAGVGFVTQGPAYTPRHLQPDQPHGLYRLTAGRPMNFSSGPAIAAMIGAIVLTATAGDVFIASAMRGVGDLDHIKAARGLKGAVWAVISESRFLAGFICMALSFFSLLFSLSHADVSLIAPAAGSLTFVSNAVAAKWVLHENVDRRRWLAAVFVCCGVALLKR